MDKKTKQIIDKTEKRLSFDNWFKKYKKSAKPHIVSEGFKEMCEQFFINGSEKISFEKTILGFEKLLNVKISNMPKEVFESAYSAGNMYGLFKNAEYFDLKKVNIKNEELPF